jgi:hypothetical protein
LRTWAPAWMRCSRGEELLSDACAVRPRLAASEFGSSRLAASKDVTFPFKQCPPCQLVPTCNLVTCSALFNDDTGSGFLTL